MRTCRLYPPALLGAAVYAWAVFSPQVIASPAIPGAEGRALHRQNEIQVGQSQLQACFNEAADADSNDWAIDGDVAQSEPQPDDLQGRPKSLSADAEATQLTAPDPSIGTRHSQAVFQRCLQQQLTGQRAPPL